MAAEGSDRCSFAADFRVGEWLVEPSLDRLSRNGTVLHLRPQLTNLLVLLARNAGRTVSKDEILSQVWDGQFVAESGMTRCIAELRQALGDDARDPKIVQTITKRGYRLLGPVTFVDPPPPPVVQPALPASGPMPSAPPDDGGEGRPTEEGSQTGLQVPLDVSLAPPPSALGRTVKAAWWTTASVVVGGVLLLSLWGAAGWRRAPVLTARDTVLLADVVNTTGDSAFDQTLRLALAMHLGQAPFLRILPASQVRAGLVLMGRQPDQPVTGPSALDLCRREGAAVLLAGSISRVGTHYAVGLEATACASGDSLARELREVKSKDEVLGALGSAAGQLRRTLGESRESLSRYDVPIVRATTPSLEALKALSLGDVARDDGRTQDSLLFYRRATEIDPQFALAWARRGAAAHNLAQLFGDERMGEPDEAKLAFRTAYDLRERVSDPERCYILGHYFRAILGDSDRAIEAYRMWSRSYPAAFVPSTNLASIYVNMVGDYATGVTEAREAVRLSPSSDVGNAALVAGYLGTGRLPEARQALRESAGRGFTGAGWRRLAFEIAFLDRNPAAMQEHFQWASADPVALVVLSVYRAQATASMGRLREARHLWSTAAGIAAQTGGPILQADVRLREAETEALLGDPRAARAAAEAALAADPREATRLFAATALALAGDPRRAERLLEEDEGHPEPGTSTGFVWRPVARALTVAGLGQAGRALQLIGGTARFERGRTFSLVPLGARAWIERAAGRPLESAATYRELIALGPVRPTSPWVAFARLGLARALREAGDVAGSRSAYDAVFEWLKEADQDAPILVAARRERAALSAR